MNILKLLEKYPRHKKRETLGSRSHTTQNLDYMFSMIA